MARSLAQKNGNDNVYTPIYLAEQIINHFDVKGKVLEPCRGTGSFFNLPRQRGCQVDWCEVDDGVDFLTRDFHDHCYDYVITNPPWSELRPFLQKSMQISDNVIFLCLVNAFFMKARKRDIEHAGFGFKEILFVDTPEKSTGWPQTGFCLGAVHIQKNYKGLVKFS